MLDKIINTEIKYVSNFSNSFEDESIIRFWDEKIPDMYTYNFTLIKKDNDIVNIISNEISRSLEENKSFLRIETNFSMERELLNNLSVKPDISVYDYMSIETDKYINLNGNNECDIKKANNSKVLEDGIEVDILANKKSMGEEFANRRIIRKADVYKSLDSQLDLYVCYNNDKPIGNCEFMINGNIAKIEDFDILDKYQRKGFGTSVLKHLLMEANESNIELAYLITDSDDTAKDMYKKCGLNKVGEKTELFFKLKD